MKIFKNFITPEGSSDARRISSIAYFQHCAIPFDALNEGDALELSGLHLL